MSSEKEKECSDNACNLNLSSEAVAGILTSFTQEKILLILRSKERKSFLNTLERYGYRLAVTKPDRWPTA
jgi:hypothetical protein